MRTRLREGSPILCGSVATREILIDPDGNCLFRAISHLIYGHQDRYQELKDLCIKGLRADSALYASDPDHSADVYLKTISEEGAWGGEPELTALATVLDRPIFVLVCVRIPYVLIYNEQGTGVPIHIKFDGKNHYTALQPIPGDVGYGELCFDGDESCNKSTDESGCSPTSLTNYDELLIELKNEREKVHKLKEELEQIKRKHSTLLDAAQLFFASDKN